MSNTARRDAVSKSKLRNDVSIPLNVVVVEITQYAPLLTDQLVKPPAGMVVAFVRLKMLREMFDPRVEQGDLRFGASRVVLASPMIRYDIGCFFFRERQGGILSLLPSNVRVFHFSFKYILAPRMSIGKLFNGGA